MTLDTSPQAATPDAQKRRFLWLLCTIGLLESAVLIAFVVYFTQQQTHSEPTVVPPPVTSTQQEVEELVLEPVVAKPVLSQEQRMDLWLDLLKAQRDAEAMHVLALPLDTAVPDWLGWKQAVASAQRAISQEQQSLMATRLAADSLALADAEHAWAFMLEEGRWIIPPQDPIDAIAEWYYRSGLRFYFAGGADNFTQAYYELSVATAFGNELAGRLAEKIAPVIPEDQRDHAVAFAINLQALMMPDEAEIGEVIQ